MITSVPNATAATDGNNAQIRVIVDGSDSSGGTGFTLDAAHSMIRGLIIDELRSRRLDPPGLRHRRLDPGG